MRAYVKLHDGKFNVIKFFAFKSLFKSNCLFRTGRRYTKSMPVFIVYKATIEHNFTFVVIERVKETTSILILENLIGYCLACFPRTKL